MTDETVGQLNVTSAESIPPALAAPKRARRQPAPVTTPPAAAPAEPTQETTVATTIENATDTLKNTAEQAKNGAEAMAADLNGRAREAMDKGNKFLAEMADFARGNAEALVESGRVAAEGLQQMGRTAAEDARKSLEAANAAVRTLAGAKSPTEFVRLQGEFARTAFDQAVAHASRNTEAMLKLAGEIAQPLSNRAALAADKMKAAA